MHSSAVLRALMIIKRLCELQRQLQPGYGHPGQRMHVAAQKPPGSCGEACIMNG